MMRFLTPLLRRLWPPMDYNRHPDRPGAVDPIAHGLDVAVSVNDAAATREQEQHELLVRAAIADCIGRMDLARPRRPSVDRAAVA